MANFANLPEKLIKINKKGDKVSLSAVSEGENKQPIYYNIYLSPAKARSLAAALNAAADLIENK